MDLFDAITVLAAANSVKRDTTNPFKVMPQSINKIVLRHSGKVVDIPKTVENLFNNPGFICSDVKKFWKGVEKDPKGYIVDAAREFRTKIIYKEQKSH
jgi:hypothetical protein